MEEESEPQNQDVKLMQNTQQVIIQCPPPPASELAPSEEGEVLPLDNDPIMDM